MVELCVSLLFSVLVLCPARLQVSLTGLLSLPDRLKDEDEAESSSSSSL